MLRPDLRYRAGRAYHRVRLARARRRPGAGDWSGVRVLGYHRVDDVPHVLAVRRDAFRRQMEAVLASGATPIRLEAALDLLGAPVEGRYVCVTFDDGYRDNLEHAEPVLRELGIPATVFVPTAVLDGEVDFYWFTPPPPALSWGDVAVLVAGGLVDVQAHTRTHPHLPRVDDERAREEIVGGRADLEAHVPYAVTSFCYPAGLYGPREVRLVGEAGYRAAVTTNPGVNPGGAPMETLRRTLVYYGDGEEDFAAKLHGLLDAPSALRDWLHRRRSRA